LKHFANTKCINTEQLVISQHAVNSESSETRATVHLCRL